MYFVDSHIHLSDKIYDEYLKLMICIIYNLKIQVYSVSVNLESSIKNIDIKKNFFLHSNLFKILTGIHPEYANLGILEPFNDFFLTNKDIIDGIGEVGLDPTYAINNSFNTFEIQKAVFTHMLDMAEKYSKPVSIHSRRSVKDVLEILTTYKLKKVVFHWYDGSKKFLRKINESGYYVSFGPYLLYSEDKKILLKESDLSLLLLETDGPVPYKRCFENVITSPAFIVSLNNFASIVLKKNFDELKEILFKNSIDFLNTQ